MTAAGLFDLQKKPSHNISKKTRQPRKCPVLSAMDPIHLLVPSRRTGKRPRLIGYWIVETKQPKPPQPWPFQANQQTPAASLIINKSNCWPPGRVFISPRSLE